MLLGGEGLRPSSQGVRLKRSGGVRTLSERPFKGDVIVSAELLEDAGRWATRYLEAVDAEEVDLRDLEDPPA